LGVLELPAKQKENRPAAAISRPPNHTASAAGRTRMSDEYLNRSTMLACCLIAAMVLLLTWAVIGVGRRVTKLESQTEAHRSNLEALNYYMDRLKQ
jgi:hypothetical protein